MSDLEGFGPRVGTAIFIVRDGKSVFLKRQGSHGADTWCTPGGHVDFGEDPRETCRREAIEETGCEVSDIKFATMTNDFFSDDNKHYVTLWFVGKWAANEPEIKEPHKCTEMRWVTFDEKPSPAILTYDNLTKEQEVLIKRMINEAST